MTTEHTVVPPDPGNLGDAVWEPQPVPVDTALVPPADDELRWVREEERRRLLFELHDCIGPTLASVALGLRALRHALELSPDFAGRLLTELEHDVQRGVTELRRLTKGQAATGLRGLGLLGTVRRDVAALASRLGGGLVIELDLPLALPALPAAVEVAAYRVVCEALTNVVRHADARLCVVRIWLDGALHIEVADDGVGLGEPDVFGVGLRSMRERARELGGDFRIESGPPGCGTRVVVRLPYGIGGA